MEVTSLIALIPNQKYLKITTEKYYKVDLRTMLGPNREETGEKPIMEIKSQASISFLGYKALGLSVIYLTPSTPSGLVNISHSMVP